MFYELCSGISYIVFINYLAEYILTDDLDKHKNKPLFLFFVGITSILFSIYNIKSKTRKKGIYIGGTFLVIIGCNSLKNLSIELKLGLTGLLFWLITKYSSKHDKL